MNPEKSIVSYINSVSQFVFECRSEYHENLAEVANRERWLDELFSQTGISQPLSAEDPLS